MKKIIVLSAIMFSLSACGGGGKTPINEIKNLIEKLSSILDVEKLSSKSDVEKLSSKSEDVICSPNEVNATVADFNTAIVKVSKLCDEKEVLYKTFRSYDDMCHFLYNLKIKKEGREISSEFFAYNKTWKTDGMSGECIFVSNNFRGVIIGVQFSKCSPDNTKIRANIAVFFSVSLSQDWNRDMRMAGFYYSEEELKKEDEDSRRRDEEWNRKYEVKSLTDPLK